VLDPILCIDAGQAIVQFACWRLDRLIYAIKFFVSRNAFRAELQLLGHPALSRLLPQIEDVCSNDDGRLRDSRGCPLPPCIIMERIESLDRWCARARPDAFMKFTVRLGPKLKTYPAVVSHRVKESVAQKAIGSFSLCWVWGSGCVVRVVASLTS
jgi:hypothetical protein